MNATIAITNFDNARERYEAFRRGEKPPPMKPKSSLTTEETELFIDKLAQVFADLYREEKKGVVK